MLTLSDSNKNILFFNERVVIIGTSFGSHTVSNVLHTFSLQTVHTRYTRLTVCVLLVHYSEYSNMIDWLISYWNPAATILATFVSVSVLCFHIYTHYDKRGRLTDISVTETKLDSDGRTNFTLNCRNKGNEDIYITDVYVEFQDKTVEYMNSSNGEESVIYNNEFDDFVVLKEKQPISDMHYSMNQLDTNENSVTGELMIKTSNKNHTLTVEFEKES